MANLISRNEPRTQLPVVVTVRPKSRFWSTYPFGGASEFLPTDKVEWDRVLRGAPLAHFVGEGLTVEPTERAPFETDEITTPKYQYRKVLSLRELKNRLPGETPYQSKTAEQRAGTLEADDEIEGVEAVANLREVMCAQFITTGVIPIVGLGVNRVVDYMLPNRKALTLTDRWGQPNVDPIEDMKRWVAELEDLGYTVTEAIVSPEVWNVMLRFQWLRELLDIRRIEMGLVQPAQPAAEYGQYRYMATLRDPYLDIYTQRSMYGPKSARKRHLPANMIVLMTAEGRQNKMVFGAYDFMVNGQFRTISGEFIREDFHDDRAAKKEVVFTSRAMPMPENVESWLVASVI